MKRKCEDCGGPTSSAINVCADCQAKRRFSKGLIETLEGNTKHFQTRPVEVEVVCWHKGDPAPWGLAFLGLSGVLMQGSEPVGYCWDECLIIVRYPDGKVEVMGEGEFEKKIEEVGG